MSETPSTMIPLGTKAPSFALLDTVTGKICRFTDDESSIATVIMFLCNHCPYVKHIQGKLVEVARIYQSKGIHFIAISSNDASAYPQDGPDNMQHEAIKHHYPFPYLYDESQAVAKAYHAACTPDFFVFDKALHCIYRGCFDESTPGNGRPVTGHNLCDALDNYIGNKPIDPEQKPSVGCNIKWK